MAADWAAIRVEYVSGVETYRAIAKRHAIKEATVRQRASREGWSDQRHTASQTVTEEAEAAIGAGRVAELVKFNDEDLRMARLIRARAAQMMEAASGREKGGKQVDLLKPADLRALASAVEAAQKIGRLALGATTENTSVTTKELPASVDEFV